MPDVGTLNATSMAAHGSCHKTEVLCVKMQLKFYLMFLDLGFLRLILETECVF